MKPKHNKAQQSPIAYFIGYTMCIMSNLHSWNNIPKALRFTRDIQWQRHIFWHSDSWLRHRLTMPLSLIPINHHVGTISAASFFLLCVSYAGIIVRKCMQFGCLSLHVIRKMVPSINLLSFYCRNLNQIYPFIFVYGWNRYQNDNGFIHRYVLSNACSSPSTMQGSII